MWVPKILLANEAIILGSQRIDNFDGWDCWASQKCKFLIFLLYNPFLQTNGITLDANPSLLMQTALK
jgi:hypothetical protein